MENFQYANLLQRVKALMIDSLVIVLFMILASQVIDKVDNVPVIVNKVILGSILLYDPITTSLLGGTFGHLIMGLRVKRVNNMNKNVILPLAILRYVFKISLGWISLITTTSNKQRRAIHDMTALSVVIKKLK